MSESQPETNTLNGQRGLYERQVAHNLLLDPGFRDAALPTLNEESFLYPSWRTIYLSVRDTGDFTVGYKAPFTLTETEIGEMNFLLEEAPSRETDWAKLLEYVEALRNEPVKYALGKEPKGQKNKTAQVSDEDISRLNQEYALVQLSNKMVILREYICPIDKTEQVDYLAPRDFGLKVGEKLGKKWLASGDKRQFDRVIFSPKPDINLDCYNLWRGFSVEPKRNDEITARYWGHIQDNVCKGDDELFTYFRSWMSEVVQEPWKVAATSLVLRGDQGVGKSIVVNIFGMLFGPHYVVISDPYRLVGKFNSLLHNKILVFGDEAFWAGDKSAEGTLKRIVGGKTLTIEYKGKDAQELPSYLHLMLASNEKWVVPAGLSERRFAVFDIGQGRKQDLPYFTTMWKELTSHDGQAALLWDLLNFPVEIDTSQIPDTEALDDQKIQSASLFDSLILLMVERGTLHEGDEGWTGELIFTRFWEELVQASKDQGLRLGISKQKVGRDLGKVLGKPTRKQFTYEDSMRKGAVYEVPLKEDLGRLLHG
jgi:hypothetical protein